MFWKQKESKEVYRNKWMWVVEDKVETDTGKQLIYGVVHKEAFALIIPWDGQSFTLVKQYRYPVSSFSWEFPQGHYEHDSIIGTAKEELREETGLSAETIKEIGSFWIGPGMTSQECKVFLATSLTKGKRALEESEVGMEDDLFSRKEIEDLIKKGELKDGPTISALALFDRHLTA